jgi:hypothetical protein
MKRAAGLQRVVDAAAAAFAGAEMSAPAKVALGRVFERLNNVHPAVVGTAEDLPVLSLLPQAVANLQLGGDRMSALGLAVADIAPDLPWTTRKIVGPTASAGFDRAHANAVLIGPNGLEPRQDVWVGLSLMAPHTRYPDHDHGPEEVYLLLSDGAFLQGDADWLARSVGQTVYNTPWIAHAMRATDQPFLALWCLPV